MYGRVLGVTVLGVGGHLVTVEAHVGRGLPVAHAHGPAGRRGARRLRAHPPRGRERRARVAAPHGSWSTSRPATSARRVPGSTCPWPLGCWRRPPRCPSAAARRGYALAGELSLKGELMPTPGSSRWPSRRRAAGSTASIVPGGERARGGAGRPACGRGAPRRSPTWWASSAAPGSPPAIEPTSLAGRGRRAEVDFADVRGQTQARRALEVAAAGGPQRAAWSARPGAGKTMLARRMTTILPGSPAKRRSRRPSCTRLPGCSPGDGVLRSRPFRAPHHSVSSAGLLGGGTSYLRPGEVSLAHHGVLFLDEFTEFRRDAIEGLRQPLEDGRVVVTRAVGSVEFPARFTLVAAANPCPCGFDGDPRRHCRCRADRVEPVSPEALGSAARPHRPAAAGAAPHEGTSSWASEHGEPSEVIRERVQASPRPAARPVGDLGVAVQRASAGTRCAPSGAARERRRGARWARAVDRHGPHRPRVRPGDQGRAHHRRPRRRRRSSARARGGGARPTATGS